MYKLDFSHASNFYTKNNTFFIWDWLVCNMNRDRIFYKIAVLTLYCPRSYNFKRVCFIDRISLLFLINTNAFLSFASSVLYIQMFCKLEIALKQLYLYSLPQFKKFYRDVIIDNEFKDISIGKRWWFMPIFVHMLMSNWGFHSTYQRL